MGTYYISFNVNSTIFNDKANSEAARAKVRRALGLFLDRKYICEEVDKAFKTKSLKQKMNSIELLEPLREIEDSLEDMLEEPRDGTTGNVFPNIRKQDIPLTRKH